MQAPTSTVQQQPEHQHAATDGSARGRIPPPARTRTQPAHALCIERAGFFDQRCRRPFGAGMGTAVAAYVRRKRGVLEQGERLLLQLAKALVELCVRERCRRGPRLAGPRAAQAERRAVVTGRRAARSAGNNPPTRPMPSAHFRPVHSNSGDTLNLNTTWLKLLPRVDTL